MRFGRSRLFSVLVAETLIKLLPFWWIRMAGTINLYCIGLKYASATSSSAIFNIVPVVAFILAVMFRSLTV